MKIQSWGLLVLVNSGDGGSIKRSNLAPAKRRLLLLPVYCSWPTGKESVHNSSVRKVCRTEPNCLFQYVGTNYQAS